MAKGIKGVSNSGTLHLPYVSADEMPWEEIEKQVRVKFDRHARQEIYGCLVRYHAHLSVEGARVPLAEIEELRRTIVNAAQSLSDVTARFRNPNGQLPSKKDEDLFLALAPSSLPDGFELTDLLHRIAPLCEKLVDRLQVAVVEDATSGALPETVGLAHFVAAVQRGASKKPARSTGINGTAQAVELERWGIPVGIKSTKMAKFCQIVLERPVTSGQVQSAVKLARRLDIH